MIDPLVTTHASTCVCILPDTSDTILLVAIRMVLRVTTIEAAASVSEFKVVRDLGDFLLRIECLLSLLE